MGRDLQVLIQGHKSQMLRAQASQVSERTQPGVENVIHLGHATHRHTDTNSSLPLGVCSARGRQLTASLRAITQ